MNTQIINQLRKNQIAFFKTPKGMGEIMNDLFNGDSWAANAFQNKMLLNGSLKMEGMRFALHLYKEGLKIEVLCHNPAKNENEWIPATFKNTCSALDRDYRVNCVLHTGFELNKVAPECVRVTA